MAVRYYLQSNPAVKFSIFRQQKNKYQINLNEALTKIIAYCIMPDHYHFILTQLKESGIKNFIQKLNNSYSHYFNLRHKQKGPVFESRFKAVRVKTQEQLIHLSRYINLNPVSSYLVEDPINYPYSSYKIYLKEEQSDLVDPSDVMVDFKSAKSYKKFVLDRKDYQRELKNIRHLTFD